MLLFGHRFITQHPFYHINDIDSIRKTPPSSALYIEFSENMLELIQHCRLNGINFALSVTSIKESVYASALEADYIVVSEKLAKSVQNIANNYLFDAKVLVKIEEEEQIEEMALLGVDGVIFGSAILHVNT